MNKKIEYYLNVLHFYLYKFFYKIHVFLDKFNPIKLIPKIPILKKRYEKLGVDIYKEIENVLINKEFGLIIIFADGFMIAILAFFFMSLFKIFTCIITQHSQLPSSYFIICLTLSLLLNYLFLIKNDKYLIYFNEFEKWDVLKKRKNGWICFLFLILVFIWVVFALSM